jgi:GNAT superfamily N-acetyltransferase
MRNDDLDIVVRPFEARDQRAARAVILAGLGEHFGAIDETLNPDLNDIAASYGGAAFLVACDGDEIVGTGALTPRPDGVAIVSRMSTAAAHRRRGVAREVLSRLVDAARERGCTRVVLGTNIDWEDAIAFYRAFGFEEMRRTPTGVLFELVL